MIAQLIPTESREQWLSERRKCICSTDIAAIVGLHPYKTPLDVFLVKTGLKEEDEVSEPMRHGILLEPYIAEFWSLETGKQIIPSGFYVMPSEPRFGATPDYDVPEENALLEIKNASFFVGQQFGEKGSDQVPDQYLIQCQWQMMVTGRGLCYLAVLIGGNDFRRYTIPRDEEIILSLSRKGINFLETYIEADCPPPLTGSPSDSEWVKKQFPIDDGSLIRSTYEIDALINNLELELERLWGAERKVEQIKNQLKNFMGTASIMETDKGKFTWKSSKPTQKINWQSITKELGATDELIQAHTECVPGSRRFLMPFKEEK